MPKLGCFGGGGMLLPKSFYNKVHTMFLPIFEDFETVDKFSWGSTTLVYLYQFRWILYLNNTVFELLLKEVAAGEERMQGPRMYKTLGETLMGQSNKPLSAPSALANDWQNQSELEREEKEREIHGGGGVYGVGSNKGLGGGPGGTNIPLEPLSFGEGGLVGIGFPILLPMMTTLF
ncbi:hypothetical protein J1N35_028556 [Gossypium stocksii]|uniref:Aminotransferase-like plant mobile domain-containing protein n=1 Tax=Gossypium stocksii TaxID=47602 RepID=A0A9D3UWX6_9ROSI|nr:hypothetical protein J1N35_028556 [Gossypium stocksii]